MNLDDLLRRYFGTSEMGQVEPQAQAAGIERLLVDFGLEQDSGKRFALWALLHLMGAAPDLDVAFEDPVEREAARNFMDMFAASDES